MASTWYVYLLECDDGTLYCGVTTDLARRLAEHNGERSGGAAYTRGRRPVALVAQAAVADRSEACKLERQVKRARREQKLALFNNSEVLV